MVEPSKYRVKGSSVILLWEYVRNRDSFNTSELFDAFVGLKSSTLHGALACLKADGCIERVPGKMGLWRVKR